MKIYILFLLLLLPCAAFGQAFTGDYKAKFISIDNTDKPEAEFQVLSNGGVSGKLMISKIVVKIKGQVDYNGRLEAESERERGTIYTLKADMSRSDRKITLMSRSEEGGAGRQGFSQTMMQGSYSIFEKPAVPSTTATVLSRDSELLIEQPNPLYEKKFFPQSVRVVVEKKPSLKLYHLEMMGGEGMDERGFYFSIARPQDSDQTIWKAENIRALNYVEKTGFDKKTGKYAGINRFRADYEMWLKDRNIYSGEIELVSENNRRMVFKINNLKIKNEANNDFVTINGIVYAEIAK